jgi:hypothetical protein
MRFGCYGGATGVGERVRDMRSSFPVFIALLAAFGSPGHAQQTSCATGSNAGACLETDADGAHLRVDAPKSPRLDVRVGGHTAFVVDPVGVTFAEPGAPENNAFSPLITLNETNPATNNKHGLRGVLYTDNTTGTINANLLALDIFTPPDNGGDVSGAYIRQTGGGNALSVFNLCRERPKGSRAYCGQGFALEAQVDGSKNSVFASAEEGSALLAVVNGASGTALAIMPGQRTSASARAIHVALPDNSRETFFVEMSGKTFAHGAITTEGGLVAYNGAPGSPVYQAIAGGQAAFFADMQRPDAIGFLVKPASGAAEGGTALAVENREGHDLARVDMNGAATFHALAVAGEPIYPILRTTSPLLGGTPLDNGKCEAARVEVLGATTTMAVSISGGDGVDPGDGFFVRGFVAAANEVTVKVCNATGRRATPVALKYNVKVIS